MNEYADKSTLPVLRQSTLKRPQLLDQLALAPQSRLTLVAGPPGYGKTTIVAQFAQQTTFPLAWHTLNEAERDVPNLFAHCVSALSKLVPELRTLELPAGVSPIDGLSLLMAQLQDALTTDTVYVLDDVHHLIGFSGAENWLRALIAEAPPLLHLILVGRALPAIPIMELVAHGQVQAIGQEQLRFSFEEVQAVAQQAGVSIAAPEVQTLLSRFHGWIAGTLLALQPLPADIQSALFAGKEGPDALFDALAEVMLHAQEEVLQHFLLASSTLSLMTPVLCQEALHLAQSRIRLEEILQHNLFTAQTFGGMTYHPLFRRFLQQYLKSHDPIWFAELHRSAGRWFEDHYRLDEAFEHFLAARDQQRAAALAEQAAQVYFAAGKLETILYWRSTLDGSPLYAPMLLYTCAMIHLNRYQYPEVDAELLEAERQFEQQQDDAGRIKVRLLRAHLDHQRGEDQRAIDQLQRLRQEVELPANLNANALFILGTAHLALGEIALAQQHLDAALPLYRDVGDAYALSQLLLSLEMTYSRAGSEDAAFAFLQEAVQLRRDLRNTQGLVGPLNNLGYKYHMLGNYELAAETFREALQISNQAADQREERYLLWSLGDLYRDRGAFDEAESFYRKALRLIASSEPILRVSVLLSLVTLYRWKEDFEESLKTAIEALALAEQHHLFLEATTARISIWTLRAVQKEAPQAQAEIEPLADRYLRYHSQPQWVWAMTLCAWVALLNANVNAAYDALKTAVRDNVQVSYLQPALAEMMHTPLLREFVRQKATRFPLLIQGMQALEAAQIVSPSVETPKATSPVMPTLSLRIWALGDEGVERDGRRVPLSAWRAKAARELFYYLLLKGATTRDQLGFVLWEDSSPEQITPKFHTTLHRLRNAIGTNAVQFEDERYFINPQIELWCDALEFSSLVQEARLTSPLRAQTETLWRRAVQLYGGDLFPEVDGPWIVAHREALQEMYLEALLGLGYCLRARRDFHGAIDLFQKAIEVDAYREDAHRAMLTCYAALGERRLVVQLFDALKTLLKADLGVSPSPETVHLAQSLLK